MNVITLHRLVDGPLSLDVARQERIEKIADMALQLLKNGSYADYSDSIMTLAALGYPTFEIFAFINDARQVAMEHVVATEMSEP